MNSVSDPREPDPPLHLRLQARPESTPHLRHQLRAWLNGTGATSRELFEIRLAATEAFANAIEHPEDRTSHLVEIEGTVTNRTVALTIRDYGRWQNDSPAKEDGGLGLTIMDALMDSVVIEPFEHGTTVTMQRRLMR